jgi:hypothetical protein
MNIFSMIFGLVPGVIQGIETIVGDKASGASKSQMAQDALAAAVATSSQVLTGSNAVYGQVAAQVAQLAINQSVQLSKASGAYQTWTAAATAAQQDAGVAAAIASLVQSIQNSTQPAAAA